MSVNLVAKNYYFVKRLHSLLGIIPLSLFMLEHFMVNSLSTVGSGPFNAMATVFRNLPYLIVIELALIILPLYLHGILGVWIVFQGSVETRVPYVRNWLYLLQRATGLIVILFVTYHVGYTRVYALITGQHDLFELMNGYLSNPITLAFYIIGVACVSFHLGNGLFNFAYKWGVTVSEKSQTWGMVVGLLVGLLFFVIGLRALFGFII